MFRAPRQEHRLQATQSTATTLGPEYEYEYEYYEYMYEDDYAERGKSKTEKLKSEVLEVQNTKRGPYAWKKRGWSECSVTCGEGQ